ncbi:MULTISPECIES: terminase [Bacillus]|uniref:terminase n=1 Tax=Bacillus TaxID=1386 RepID=UPI000D043023|nr:terminase [Halalkalibacterium halodurans]MCV0025342.1 terminase [Bacillus sp. XT-2]PRS04262.1 terminase [Bacillus halotolerans]PRS20432.1 terminase [Bacillus halotolerans]QKS04068.1 terminase [Bacillus halotolerans]
MAYEEKTDWLPDDPINEDDVNRWEKGIKDAHTDLAAHKNDMNNPHNTTKAQIGLGNVDNVQQAAKKDFDQHEQDQVRHITSIEREKWNSGQLSKITNDDGQPVFNIANDFHTELLNYPTLTYFSYSGLPLNSPGGSGRGFWTCSDSKLYGHVIVMTNDNRTYRKTLSNGNWSDWIELETTNGAQTKVNAHAAKSDIHVTQAEKDKWNNSQLFKITADNGQGKLYLNETDDFHEIVPKNTGMVHFTSASNTVNGPGTSVRGIWTVNAMGNYGQIIAFDNANKTYRKTISGGNWSEWIELETTVGAQSKVSNHAMDSTAHITTEERNKWNAGQLSKITNDAGGVLVSIGDADDFLSKIVQTGEKFGTFYSTGKPTNAPSALSTRGFFHFTATDSNGNGTFGYVVAIDYKNNMFTNYVDGNLGWQGWNKVESEIGSQSKADKAVTDAKNYVDTNYTNEKLIVQQSSVAIQDARTPGTDYPLGITICTINNNNDTGYPLGYGMIKNEKWSHYRFAQYFYGNGDTTNGKNDHVGTWIRHWWNESGWTPWEKISGFAHAIIGRTGKQALNKGEQNKIIFKNIIKDSNNLFDLSNSRFIASHAGMYLVNASLYIENTLQYSNFELYAYVNGSQYKLMNQFRMPSPKDNDDSKEFYATVTGSATVPLNAGDYVEIYVYVGYTGTASRYIFDNPNSKNYFDILELGGQIFPTR